VLQGVASLTSATHLQFKKKKNQNLKKGNTPNINTKN
jgi:hypothetical protein